jgi:hypothetical protein
MGIKTADGKQNFKILIFFCILIKLSTLQFADSACNLLQSVFANLWQKLPFCKQQEGIRADFSRFCMRLLTLLQSANRSFIPFRAETKGDM